MRLISSEFSDGEPFRAALPATVKTSRPRCNGRARRCNPRVSCCCAMIRTRGGRLAALDCL
jgi:hypothetical protein